MEIPKVKKKNISGIGIRVHPAVHELMKKAAPIAGSQIGEAYTQAAVDWLKKNSNHNSVMRALIEEARSKNAELREILHSLKLIGKPNSH